MEAMPGAGEGLRLSMRMCLCARLRVSPCPELAGVGMKAQPRWRSSRLGAASRARGWGGVGRAAGRKGKDLLPLP